MFSLRPGYLSWETKQSLSLWTALRLRTGVKVLVQGNQGGIQHQARPIEYTVNLSRAAPTDCAYTPEHAQATTPKNNPFPSLRVLVHTSGDLCERGHKEQSHAKGRGGWGDMIGVVTPCHKEDSSILLEYCWIFQTVRAKLLHHSQLSSSCLLVFVWMDDCIALQQEGLCTCRRPQKGEGHGYRSGGQSVCLRLWVSLSLTCRLAAETGRACMCIPSFYKGTCARVSLSLVPVVIIKPVIQ